MELQIRKLLLYFFVITIPLSNIKSPIPLLNLSLFILLLYLILSLPALNSFSILHINRKPFIYLVALYVLILGMSVLNYIPGTEYSLSFLRHFPMYIVFLYLVSDAIIHRILNLRTIMFLFLIGYSILLIQFLLNVNVTMSGEGRATISGINPNRLAVLSDIAIIFSLNLLHMFKHNVGIKLLLYAVFPVAIYLAISTGSKGGYVGLIIAIAVYYYFRNDGTKLKMKKIIKIIFFVTIISLIFFSDDLIYSRFFNNDSISDGDRISIWDNAIKIFFDSPFFGVGVFRYENDIVALQGNFQVTHNEFLTILIYSGIIGFIFFVLFLFKLFRLSFKTNKVFGNPLFLSLISIVVFNLFKGGGALLSTYIWFVFSLLTTSIYFSDRKIKIKKNSI